jgi:uncharacterized protein with HEPN domain
MKKSPSPFLNHIIEAATIIQEYTASITEAEFYQNQLVQDAVIRRLEVVGEACSKLADNFKQSHSKIPWKKIIAMRNRLTHEYWDIDLKLVWQTASKDVKQLKNDLLNLFEKIGK